MAAGVKALLRDARYAAETPGARAFTFDAFAGFYNALGWRSCELLELLDHRKWGRGGGGRGRGGGASTGSRSSAASDAAVAPSPPPAAAAAAPPPQPAAADPTLFTFPLPEGRFFTFTASDARLMAELRSAAGLSDVGAAEFCGVVLGALLDAAARAPVDPASGGAVAVAAAAAARRAITRDPATPVLLHAWNAALARIVPSHALAPARKRTLYLALTTLFFVVETYAGGTSAECAGIPACELVAALLFLCDGSKTEKLAEAFKLAAGGEGGALDVNGTASLLRGAVANLAAVRSPVHEEAASAEETEAMDLLAEAIQELAVRLVREAARGAPGRITYAELCDWYNAGGAAHVGFLELLDWKKVAAAQ